MKILVPWTVHVPPLRHGLLAHTSAVVVSVDVVTDVLCGYSGSFCQTYTSPCQNNPCFNWGSCVSNGCNSYTCTCPCGFAGTNCQTYTSPCSKSPCLNGGSCTATGCNTYTCTCPTCYSGLNCQTLTSPCQNNPCLNNPCLNGATCAPNTNANWPMLEKSMSERRKLHCNWMQYVHLHLPMWLFRHQLPDIL
jgi:hypothetical protein